MKYCSVSDILLNVERGRWFIFSHRLIRLGMLVPKQLLSCLHTSNISEWWVELTAVSLPDSKTTAAE